MTDFGISLGDIIAFIALLLSLYVAWRTHTFKKREAELLEIQCKLNTLILDKEEQEAAHQKMADLSANFVTIGSKKHRLRISNRGKATAYHVTIGFPEGNDIIPEEVIHEKFPLESLESGQSVELIAVVGFGTKSKLAVQIAWQSDSGEKKDKVVYVTR